MFSKPEILLSFRSIYLILIILYQAFSLNPSQNHHYGIDLYICQACSGHWNICLYRILFKCRRKCAEWIGTIYWERLLLSYS